MSFQQRGISHIFHDLRDIPVRSEFHDEVVCLSTLEHVGFDNRICIVGERYREQRHSDFVVAMAEMNRAPKPGGRLWMTVPFGKYRHYTAFQQFDEALRCRAIHAFGKADQVRQAYFRYTADGWQAASQDECAASEYVEWVARSWDGLPDSPPVEPDRAAARAVAYVELVKG